MCFCNYLTCIAEQKLIVSHVVVIILCVLLQVYQLWVVRAIVVMGKMCTTMQMLVLRVSLTVQLLVAAHLGVR